MEEIWKDVPGYERIYEVSSLGNIRSLVSNKGIRRTKILSPSKSGRRYKSAVLYKDGLRTEVALHRLICMAFFGPSEGKQVNHKNGDRFDNRIENLEYMTAQENTAHGRRILGKCVGEKNGGAKITEKDVRDIRRRFELCASSFASMGRQYGISEVQVARICKRQIWKHILP